MWHGFSVCEYYICWLDKHKHFKSIINQALASGFVRYEVMCVDNAVSTGECCSSADELVVVAAILTRSSSVAVHGAGKG